MMKRLLIGLTGYNDSGKNEMIETIRRSIYSTLVINPIEDIELAIDSLKAKYDCARYAWDREIKQATWTMLKRNKRFIPSLKKEFQYCCNSHYEIVVYNAVRTTWEHNLMKESAKIYNREYKIILMTTSKNANRRDEYEKFSDSLTNLSNCYHYQTEKNKTMKDWLYNQDFMILYLNKGGSNAI